MQGDSILNINCVPEGQFIKNLCLKGRKWVLVTAGEAIAQDNLAGIIIHTSGTLTLIDGDGTEIDCGTPDAAPFTVSPLCPASIKATSTAVVYAVYEA